MVSSPPQDETAGMEKPNRLIASRDESNLWGARREQTLPSLRGLESQKISGRRRGFFLDFPFYRTSQVLGCIICEPYLVMADYPCRDSTLRYASISSFRFKYSSK